MMGWSEWSGSHPGHPDYSALVYTWNIPGNPVYMYAFFDHGDRKWGDWAPTLASAKRRIAADTWPGWRWVKVVAEDDKE